MTLLMYRGSGRKRNRALDKRDTFNFEELEKKAKDTKKWIHPNLRFEEIVKNKTPQVGQRTSLSLSLGIVSGQTKRREMLTSANSLVRSTTSWITWCTWSMKLRLFSSSSGIAIISSDGWNSRPSKSLWRPSGTPKTSVLSLPIAVTVASERRQRWEPSSTSWMEKRSKVPGEVSNLRSHIGATPRPQISPFPGRPDLL